MHLDERLEKSREALGKQLAVGQQKVSSAYNRLWAEMEAMREAQKQRAEEARLQAEKEGKPVDDGKKCTLPESGKHIAIIPADTIATGKAPNAPDLTNARASAGAYFSSWGTWASEKRKGWGTKTPVVSPTPLDVKHAGDFESEKEKAVGEVPATPVAADTPYRDDARRSSVFFDAENDKGESKQSSPAKERRGPVVGLGLELEEKRESRVTGSDGMVDINLEEEEKEVWGKKSMEKNDDDDDDDDDYDDKADDDVAKEKTVVDKEKNIAEKK